MRRIVAALACALLVFSLAAPPSACAAGKKTVYILNVENDGARMRKEPNSASDNVEVSLKKGTKVFYLGKSGAWCKVRSEYGPVGWVYKGYLKYYGAVSLSSVYVATEKASVYRKSGSGVKKVGTVSKKQFVIVRATSTNWAYVYTLSGTSGYVKLSSLTPVQ